MEGFQRLTAENYAVFITTMQAAFNNAAASVLGAGADVLPRADIEASLTTPGAVTYQVVRNGQLLAGAIVVIDKSTQINHLDFLFVAPACQGKGIGYQLWQTIEQCYPATKIWLTATPWFDQRNLHFYINRCGFRAVRFYNDHFPDPDGPGNSKNDAMFEFEKVME